MKFRELASRAQVLAFDAVHWPLRRHRSMAKLGLSFGTRGADNLKDQSYAGCLCGPEELTCVVLPLGMPQQGRGAPSGPSAWAYVNQQA